MTPEQLDELLAELRAVGSDHGTVEAKKAQNRLPSTTWETMSAFANTDGGILLLGVDEGDGSFDVVGVEDPAQVISELQSACAELEPPLRPPISVVEVEGKMVVVAELAPVPRSARPCHRRSQGAHNGSFVRIGDADQALTAAEVDEMLANRSNHDDSRRPAPDHARLDRDATSAFCARVRKTSESAPDQDPRLLARWGLTDEAGHPSVAGLLALGEEPAAISSAARVDYRSMPRSTDPAGSRQRAQHIEGTVGTLLDRVVRQIGDDLGVIQVEREGHVVDDADVPLLAVREVISNALLHRSLSSAQESASVSVEVDETAVVVVSPGGLHVGADTSLLGLDVISGVRNLTLVRTCEQLTTPAGNRIIENQAGGIARADQECRALGTMPALFIDLPSRFQVVLFRGALDLEAARAFLAEHGATPGERAVRLVAVAQRLARAVEATPISGLSRVSFDSRLAARALAPSTVDDAATLLVGLERDGVFVRRHARHGNTWALASDSTPATSSTTPSESPPGRRRRRGREDRVMDVLLAIADSETGQLRSGEIGAALGLRSPTSTNRWITRAGDRNLIEPTTESLSASNRRYRLTPAGEALVRQHRGG